MSLAVDPHSAALGWLYRSGDAVYISWPGAGCLIAGGSQLSQAAEDPAQKLGANRRLNRPGRHGRERVGAGPPGQRRRGGPGVIPRRRAGPGGAHVPARCRCFARRSGHAVRLRRRVPRGDLSRVPAVAHRNASPVRGWTSGASTHRTGRPAAAGPATPCARPCARPRGWDSGSCRTGAPAVVQPGGVDHGVHAAPRSAPFRRAPARLAGAARSLGRSAAGSHGRAAAPRPLALQRARALAEHGVRDRPGHRSAAIRSSPVISVPPRPGQPALAARQSAMRSAGSGLPRGAAWRSSLRAGIS